MLLTSGGWDRRPEEKGGPWAERSREGTVDGKALLWALGVVTVDVSS